MNSILELTNNRDVDAPITHNDYDCCKVPREYERNENYLCIGSDSMYAFIGVFGKCSC